MRSGGLDRRVATPFAIGLLAVLAYVPALASSPGRMPGDTKLYLYLDPGGLLGRAASTFEPDQYLGWVPFQQIAYLWPSGPWYLLFDRLGAPDWVAHRLWLGTILLAAGAGVYWCSRRLHLPVAAAIAGAVVYQLSPYLLPYISRTSLLLLPWAGLGWIVGLTVVATRRAGTDPGSRLVAWREPALIALIVATVGPPNATTLAMIVPAPVLWIVHTTWLHDLPWRRALAVTGRITALCLGVSLGWVAMLATQARHGADVLGFTETLEDVSRNATGSEVLRGLGYWLFYQRDPFGPATTASSDYLVSATALVISYGAVALALAGLTIVTWRHRRFAASCVATGAVLAVGVHPIGDSSPLMALLSGDTSSSLALALRSSTRAVPVMLLGVSLATAALIAAVPERAPRRLVRPALAAAVVVIALVNLPALWERSLVDPVLERDQDPPTAWLDAVAVLDADGTEHRVLQVPGSEFGAFRWGYTGDHPLVGLSDRALATRDLLPLGSPPAMDVVFAVDDRLQEGIHEPGTFAPAARFLGADVIWVSNDLAVERFRTTRPEIVHGDLTDPDVAGLGDPMAFGQPVVNRPGVDLVDPTALADDRVGAALAPVVLVPVDDPVGVVRAKTTTRVLSGSADGLLDAAAAGLLSGHELVRYSATVDELGDGEPLIVTDTNRDQARHWRGSQDVRGHTEPGGPDDDVLVAAIGDRRLDPFGGAAVGDETADRQTIAIQQGPVVATASSYGEPFAYRPEDRAAMAVDGDPTTAWRVADHGEPRGERIRLDLRDADAPPTSIRLVQAPPAAGARTIATVTVTVDGGTPTEVDLTPASLGPNGQVVDVGPIERSVEITIVDLVPGVAGLAADLAGVGFAEIDLGLGPTTEVIRPPIDGIAASSPSTPMAVVLTRWRTDATDPWRSDPEPELRRTIELPTPRTFGLDALLRVDPHADDAEIAELVVSATDLPDAVALADARLTGSLEHRGVAAVDGDPSTAWITPFDDVVGRTLTIARVEPLGATLVVDQPTGPYSTVTAVRLVVDGDGADLTVDAPDGDGRSRIEIPPSLRGASGRLELTITEIDPALTVDRRYGTTRTLPAAVGELSATDGIRTVTVDPGVESSAVCRQDLISIDEQPVGLQWATTVGALLAGDDLAATGCDDVELDAGSHRIDSANRAAPGLTVDRVVLAEATVPAAADPSSLVGVEVTRDDPRHRTVTVDPCPDGCWLVLGEGFNEAWSASAEGVDLGAPALVDGGFNGWLLPPGDAATTVDLRWDAQTPVTVALVVVALVTLACIAIVVLTHRHRRDTATAEAAPSFAAPTAPTRPILAAAAAAIAVGVLVDPVWGVATIVPGAVLVAIRRRSPSWTHRVLEITGLAAFVAMVTDATLTVRAERPVPDAGWTDAVAHLNSLALVAVVVIAAGAAFGADASREHRA